MEQEQEVLLPDGSDDKRYLRAEKVWPNLTNRLGMPRITAHPLVANVLEEIKSWPEEKQARFSFLDAGCGHGNDIRALRRMLGGKGRYIGINLSLAEIMQGLDFYRTAAFEKTEEARKLFGIAYLDDLSRVMTWNEAEENFSLSRKIKDEEIDLLYMEAVLQAAGYGYKTYRQKKAAAQGILNELARVCKPRGMFLGRVTTFAPYTSREWQMKKLQETNNWRFIPRSTELEVMLNLAGFVIVLSVADPHEKALVDPDKREIVKTAFLAMKK